MPVERASVGSSIMDVLDRVLDKGIVIDAWVRVSVIGIDLITVEARVTVASIHTYLRYADLLAQTGPAPVTEIRPAVDPSRLFGSAPISAWNGSRRRSSKRL
jgi:hypothetical protein